MRPLTIVTMAVVLLVGRAPIALGQTSVPPPEFDVGVSLGSYITQGSAVSGTDGQEGSASAVVWTEVAPELIGLRGEAGTLPDGNPCMSLVAQTFDTAENASVTVQNLTALRDLGQLPPACPDAPSVSPEMLALSFWERSDLPVPNPHMAPGWALTGMRAYLEVNSAATADFAYQTPFGPLTISAWTDDVFVFWGDGWNWERYDSLGGPWPHGDIVHIYADKGSADITVTQAWTATWNLAGQHGTLQGATTTGTINDFQLRELEAVLG